MTRLGLPVFPVQIAARKAKPVIVPITHLKPPVFSLIRSHA